MANLFSSGSVNNPDPVAVGLRVQSNLQGTAIPIGCGLTRWSPPLIDYDGFTATPATTPGGKGGVFGSGGKGNTGQYDYAASGIMLLGEGQVTQINTIYNGSNIDFLVQPSAQVLADLNNIGINTDLITYWNGTYNTILHSGTYTDTPDSWWAGQFGARALGYRGLAYFVVPNLYLGSSPSWPSLNVEALWQINSDIPALSPDANPSDWIQAFLTNQDWGVQGFPASCIGNFATAQSYWRATGMLISHALTSPTSGNSHLKTLMEALNADFRWSNGALDIVPYGDVPVTGNGYTYTPNVTPLYALGPDDFLENQGSLGNASGAGKSFVAFSRAAVSDIVNKLQIEYLDRANLYNPVTIYATDDASIVAQGRLRLSDLKQNHFFNMASAASMSVQLQLARLLAAINTYQITVGRQFVLVDVMDYLSITEPALQLVNQLVRVTEVQENSDTSLTMTLEEVPLTASAPVYARQASLGLARNANVPPGNVNAPFFFEPPDQLGGGLVLQIGLSGVSPATFGGCDVWLSTDGANFDLLGRFSGATRMGVLTSPLASVSASVAPPTIDATNTLAVSLAESAGALISCSPTAFAAAATVSVVDGEVIAYQTATLTGANAYALTTLMRGAYQSTIAAHASGAPFMRLDGSVFDWNFSSAQVGTTVYFKFCAYNQFGVATQQLSDVGAYPYTVQGSALSSPLPNIANLTTRFTGGFQEIFWDEIQDFRSGILYEIRQGATWSGGLPIATQAHPPFIARGTGTYWVAAKCTPVAGMLVYSATPQGITIAGNMLSSYNVLSYNEQASGWPGSRQLGLGLSGVGANEYLRIGSAQNVLTDTNVLAQDDILDAGGIPTGAAYYYTSANIVNASYNAQIYLNASATFAGVPVGQNILSVPDILASQDILGAASTQYIQGWIEVRIGVAGAPITWGSWQKFVPGVQTGQFVQFRIALLTNDPNSIPYALSFNYQVDLPARIDHYQNLTILATGLTVTFQPDGASVAGAFNGGPTAGKLPSINVDWGQQAAVDYVITGLSLSGLTITFYNSSAVAVIATGVQILVQGY